MCANRPDFPFQWLAWRSQKEWRQNRANSTDYVDTSIGQATVLWPRLWSPSRTSKCPKRCTCYSKKNRRHIVITAFIQIFIQLKSIQSIFNVNQMYLFLNKWHQITITKPSENLNWFLKINHRNRSIDSDMNSTQINQIFEAVKLIQMTYVMLYEARQTSSNKPNDDNVPIQFQSATKNL